MANHQKITIITFEDSGTTPVPAPGNLYINIGGSWATASNVYILVGSEWKTSTNLSVLSNSSWNETTV